MKVVNFLIYQNLTGELGGLYYSDVPGDNSGEYVSLAEHENLMADYTIAQAQLFNLPATNKLLTKIEMENKKLEALLKQWEKLGLRLFQIAESAGLQGIPKLIQLIQDTKEVLK